MARSFSHHVGIDENGLGPQLGPLVVTAVRARTTAEGAALLASPDLSPWPRIDDSKKLCSTHDTRLGEAWARALVPQAKTPQQLIGKLVPGGLAWAKSPCPSPAGKTQCWGARGEGFGAEEELLQQVRADVALLASKGVVLDGVWSRPLCAARLHDQKAEGHSLSAIDQHAMEALSLLALGEKPDKRVLNVVCGKVGNTKHYLPKLGPLQGWLVTVLEESKVRSRYRFAGLGEVAFAQNADGHNLLVALASLVGKYVRELLMGRIVRFYRQKEPNLGSCSGYRDLVTKAFVDGTEPLRRELGILPRCFLRP